MSYNKPSFESIIVAVNKENPNSCSANNHFPQADLTKRSSVWGNQQWIRSQFSCPNSPQPYERALYSFKGTMCRSGRKMLPKLECQHFLTYIFAFACCGISDFVSSNVTGRWALSFSLANQVVSWNVCETGTCIFCFRFWSNSSCWSHLLLFCN